MRDNSPTVDEYWEALAQVLPSFTPAEGRAALTLYRELAKGKPVDAAQLGQALGVTAAEARAVLDRDSLKRSVYPDDQGRVVGFGGLATAPTHHRLEVDGRALWTWCAWDTLFLPERLGQRARVVSPDPESGHVVELVLSPHEIESVQPEDAVVSFLLPGAGGFTSAANTIAKFCHFVFFFASRASGERWVAKHPGTFLHTVEDAFELARRANAKHFGSALPRRAADRPIACSLTAGEFKDRLAWIAELTHDALVSHTRRDLVLDMRFTPAATDRVRELVRREQGCCAFLTYHIHEEPGEIQLTITAPEHARLAADALFEPFVPMGG